MFSLLKILETSMGHIALISFHLSLLYFVTNRKNKEEKIIEHTEQSFLFFVFYFPNLESNTRFLILS